MFEEYIKFGSFKVLNKEITKGYKNHIANCKNKKGETISKSTLEGKVKPIENFFYWLMM